jgi:hypothetical protein
MPGWRCVHGGVKLVVDEGADGIGVDCQHGCLRHKPGLDEPQCVLVVAVLGLEKGPVIGFGAEDDDLHGWNAPARSL